MSTLRLSCSKSKLAVILAAFRGGASRMLPFFGSKCSTANRSRIEENNHESRSCRAKGRHDAHFYG